MKYSVVTTFNEAGLKSYGQKMIDTFELFWPNDVDLYVCAENCSPRTTRPNTTVIDLLAQSFDLNVFLKRHKDNPLAHGLDGPADVFHPKKQFKWDAVRFCYKVYSIALVSQRIDSGWLIWLDADTVTHSSISANNLAKLLPIDSMISYLGRGEQYHSECGWVGYNLDHPQTKKFIADFVGMYNTDAIFKEREWHDSYIWDVVRRCYQQDNRFYNLNQSEDVKGLAGHPFINSDLGLFMDHAKGARKNAGASKASDVKMHRTHPYWQRILKGRA